MRLTSFLILLFLSMPAWAQEQAPQDEILVWRGDATIYQAEDLLRAKRFSESLDILDRILSRNIRNADAQVDKAIAWYNLGNMDKAKEAYKNALAIDKGHMGAYVVGALVSLKDDDRNQAEYFMNALKVVCQSDLCPEYIYVQRMVREAKQ